MQAKKEIHMHTHTHVVQTLSSELAEKVQSYFYVVAMNLKSTVKA